MVILPEHVVELSVGAGVLVLYTFFFLLQESNLPHHYWYLSYTYVWIMYSSQWESLVRNHSWYKPVLGTVGHAKNPF